MGNFVIHKVKDLFADNFRRKSAFGLVGKLVVWKIMRSLCSKFFRLLPNYVNSVVCQYAYGNYRLKSIIQRNILCYLNCNLLLVLYQIDLVKDKDNVVIFLKSADYLMIPAADPFCDVGNHKYKVNVRSGLYSSSVHMLAELRFSLMDTRGVHKHKLSFVLCYHACYPCSGSLRLSAYRGYLFTHKNVQKRGFPCVCTTGYRYKFRFRIHFISFPVKPRYRPSSRRFYTLKAYFCTAFYLP